jgi:hypothetical protein
MCEHFAVRTSSRDPLDIEETDMRAFAPRWMLAVFVAAGMVASALAQDYAQDADEEKVALDQVPAAVKEKAASVAKGTTFTRAFRDKSKNFRLVGKNAEGGLVVAQLSEEGQFIALTTRTASNSKKVPRAVTKALDAERKKNTQLQGFRPSSIEEADVFTAAKGKMEHLFQFRGTNAEGLAVQVDVTPEGDVASAGVVLIHPDSGKADVASKEDGKDGGKQVKLPPELAQAVQEAVPGIQIAGATEQKSRGGAVSYLVNGQDAQGHKVVVDIGSNGTIATIRYDLMGQEVPPQALAMAMQRAEEDQRLSGFRPAKMQRLELRQLGSVAFAFTGKTTAGKSYEVRVLADGSDVAVVPVVEDKAAAADGTTADSKKTTGKKTTRTKKPR